MISGGRRAAQRALQTLATAGLLALVAAVLAAVPAQAASSTITGVVTVSGSSTPIVGAQVTTQPASSTATTDSSGAYTLNVTAGTYTVLFAASGFNADFIAGIIAPANGTVAANASLIPVPANAAEDLFSRPDQSGIGMASDGHTWSNDLSKYPNGTVSIVGRQAFIQCFTAQTDHDTWMGIPYRDEEITADMNFQHGGRLLARVQGSDAWIVLALNSSSKTLVLWFDNFGNWAQVGSVAHSFSPSVWYHTKLDVIGGSAYGKAWLFGTTEPAWQVSASGIPPALMPAGVGGLRCAMDDVYFANYLETPITQISGKVTEAGTGTALAGATVSLNTGPSTTTDASGNYVLGGLAAGTYTVTASASGHNPASMNATVSTGLSALVTNLALSVQAATVSGSPSPVNSGGTLTVSWGGIVSPSAGDWFGLYLVGAPDSAPVSWSHTTGTASGSLALSVPGGISAGTYELRLFANSSYARLAKSGPLTVQAATVSGSPSPVNSGGTLTVSWGGVVSPSAGDWFGLYLVGAPDSAPVSWSHTTGTASGSLALSVPGGTGAGTYELRLFANSSYARLAKSGPLTVQAATVSGSPNPVNSGSTLTVSWGGVVSPSAGDWFGLYLVGAPDSAPVSWSHTTGTASGSLALSVPGGTGAGTYELRLFANSSYMRLATSSPVRVN